MVYVSTTARTPHETRVQPPPGGSVGAGWLVLAGVVLLAALVTGLLYSGAAAARQLGDPGALTRWGLPVAKALTNTAAAGTIGALVFAVVLLPLKVGENGRKPRQGAAEHPALSRALLLASVAAVGWTVGALGVLIFTYSDAAGLPLSSDPTYTQGLAAFLTDFSTGRAWLVTAIVSAVLATVLFGVRSQVGLGLALVLALLNLLPMALIGHSASGDDHNAAVNSIALHLVGVCLWAGGLIALAVVSGKLGDQALPVLKRFSALAGFAFLLVVASGVVNASLRITDLAQLGSSWGLLVTFKTVATLLLGGIGWMHRQWIIPQLEAPEGTAASSLSARRVLWQFITVELLVMGAVFGVAGALGRTAPPRAEVLPTEAGPARILTGYDLPPEPTLSRWFTEWRPDWLWIAVALTLGVAYVSGVLKLRRRGDSWSVLKLVSWLLGLVLLTYFTSGAPAVYGMVLFSAHMIDHMALTMVVPLFLVLGAPVTLALRALGARRDGTRGIREWILAIVHSWPSRLITHPLFAAGNFVASIIVFYYSSLFGFALREHVGHELMITHFLLTGYIFVLSMIGTDPVPYRAPYPLRILLLFATMAFHAFFGVALMGSTSLLQASWFGNMGRDWGGSALADQQVGGAVTWGVGEIPTLLLAIGVAVMWSRSDARETKRTDRAADRNNDADLAAYNSMFTDLAARDVGPRGSRPPSAARTSTAGDDE
ncbi:cytochrome c oxidase assembly protein [uncultured Arthrobacter sp.]|uniref:cytochrome c oxidase assembly protein n=1 Tax=uncultured Arthrobacter sp. TaxID=114050 RepID=UPI002639ADC8|nr:cytochrome c oxidase assembly protein [uncultured Arthrobacter sp.]